MYSISKKFNYTYSILFLLGSLGTSSCYAFNFSNNFDSIEMYMGFGIANNSLSYKKNSTYNFNSSGGSCITFTGDSCSPLQDPVLNTANLITYNKSKREKRIQLTPSFGINFVKNNFNAALEASYFFGDININNKANNWKTLPTNPIGIRGTQAPFGTPFIISPMGQTINASLNEKFSDMFTLSLLPGYQFNDWLKGFFKVGWSTMKFSSNSNGGTRGGAGYFGRSGNYSKRLHGLLLGLGIETRFNGYDFRLEYNKIRYSGFSVNSNEWGSTISNTETVTQLPGITDATGNINFQGQTKTKYKKITSDIVMLSVIKKFDILNDD